ncbi:MAG: DUF6883 domain-containing protein [candidate division KSB1 bacterium]
MKLVSFTTIIAPEKLRDYLLNPSHDEGKSKARFLNEMGYEQTNWQILEADLRAQHLPVDVIPGKQSLFGTKYEIVAPLIGPNGQKRWIRSIWMIRRRESVVRFVTLIPELKQ